MGWWCAGGALVVMLIACTCTCTCTCPQPQPQTSQASFSTRPRADLQHRQSTPQRAPKQYPPSPPLLLQNLNRRNETAPRQRDWIPNATWHKPHSEQSSERLFCFAESLRHACSSCLAELLLPPARLLNAVSSSSSPMQSRLASHGRIFVKAFDADYA